MKGKKIFLLLAFLVTMMLSTSTFASITVRVTEHEGASPSWNYAGKHNFTTPPAIFNMNGVKAFCIQHQVRTDDGRVYDDPKVYAGAVPGYQSEMGDDLSIAASLNAATQDNGATDYWNYLNPVVRQKINAAYMWFISKYPNNEHARVATQAFLWGVTCGDAWDYQIDMNWTFSGYKKQGKLGYRITNGEDYITWTGAHGSTEQGLYTQLKDYVAHFDGSKVPVFAETSSTKKATIAIGESKTFTDTTNDTYNGLRSGEWKVVGTYPAGIVPSIDPATGQFTVQVTNAFTQGYWDGFIQLERFADAENNTGNVRIYGNSSGNQILFAGGFTKAVNYKIEAVGAKIRISKLDKETGTTAQGDAELVGAVYNVSRVGGGFSQDITIGADLTATTNWLPTGTYEIREIKAPTGYTLSTDVKTIVVSANNIVDVYVEGRVEEVPIVGDIKIYKGLQETDYDAEIQLAGAQFTATLISNPSKVYYSNISGDDGVCLIQRLPYGTYRIHENKVPSSAFAVADFDCKVDTNLKEYEFVKVDTSKKMRIEVFKSMVVNAGEATDAKVSNAVFTVYTDEAGTNPYRDKNGNVVTVGPTDESGYAISDYMRTGNYYLKETTFPEGADPDALVPGENVTYRNKVYNASVDNTTQTAERVTKTLYLTNVPNRNKIEIIKKVGETSNTPKFPLDQCEFTATLKSTIGTDHVFSRKCTAETDRDTGYCVIEDLPYGEYVVEETKVSPITLKCANFDIFVGQDKKVLTAGYKPANAKSWAGTNPLDADGAIVDVPKVIKIKVQKVDANRTEADSKDMTQGDASLYNAIYQIYRYDPMTDGYTEYVYDIKTDHKDSDGYVVAESGELLIGNYMVKEKVKSTEVVDGKTVKYSYAEGYLVDEEEYYFEVKPETQDVRISYHETVSKEEVVRGSLKVIKYDNKIGTGDVPSKGAKLRLTLDSNPNVYYDCTIDGEGKGEFVEEKSMSYYPYTLPYGQYTITELKESDPEEHTSWYIQSEAVTIKKQGAKEYRIESDEPVKFYLQIQKRDADNGAKVQLKGAKYKVWDVEKGEFIHQMIYPSGKIIDEFEVDSTTGLVTLPETLEAGKFIIYETQSPEGYYLEENLRIPENTKDIGNAKVAGLLIDVTKASMNVVESEQYHKVDLFYVADVSDRPLKAKLEVEKKGEVLADAEATTIKYGEEYTPVYKMQGLANVTYDIIAAEDIKSKDGTQVYVNKGQKVDTITTNSEGYAITQELYVGEYRVVETKTPEGYLVDNNIPNVTLTSDNRLQRINTISKALNDDRQKLALTFPKVFEDINFADSTTVEKWAVFGVYTNADVKSKVTGKVVIPKNSLVEVIKVSEDNANVQSVKDLPAGTYTVKELDASYPYSISKEVREVTLSHSGNTQSKVVTSGTQFVNTYEKGSITLIKISSSNMENVVLNGSEINKKGLDEQVDKFISQIQGMSRDEIAKAIEASGVKCVGGAKYNIYTDSECKKQLYIKEDKTGELKPAIIETDESGLVVLENIPIRNYYLVEVEAPVGYEINNEKVEIELTNDNKDSMVYQALVDDSTVGELIVKTDIFTGELIPNCIFEIAKVVEDGEDIVLMHATTDEEGIAYIPTDLFEEGQKYTYTETYAPDKYKIDKTPHEFVASFDEEGHWNVEKISVTNTRGTTTVTLIKTDDKGNRVPNCVFELKSEETGFYEKGTTDENGIYVFYDVPYGKYTYTELEAPEEYEIDTTPHEIDIYGETMDIHFVNTGDIAVYALSTIALVSVLGIAFLVTKKLKASK